MWLSLGFDSISACLLPSDTCSLSRQEGGKAAAAWGKITHLDRIVTTCGGLLWWKSLPVPMEVRWHLRMMPALPSLCASLQWCISFQGDLASSTGILSHASPPSCCLCCIHAANSVPLPWSVLSTPCFSTQSLPVSVDSFLRKCPWLILKKALEWVVLRPLEPSQPVETLANWVGKAHSEGSPYQHPWMPKRLAGGGRDCNGSYIPSAPFNNDTVLLWCPALFSDFPSCGAPYSHPSWLSFLASICPLPGSILPTPLSSNQSLFATDNSWFRLECAEVWCRSCVKFDLFVLLFTDHPLCSLILFCPSWFSHLEGFFLFLSVRTSLHIHIQHPIRVAGPFFDYSFLFFFLSSFLVVRGFLF